MTPTPNPTAESVIAEAVPYTTVATAEGEHSQAIRARLLSEGAPSEERRGINLMRDLGFDESDPEVVKARADAAFEEQIERARLEIHRVMASEWAVIATALKMDQGQYDSLLSDLARAALTAAGVAPQKPSASDRDTWLCGKCEREKMLGRDDGQIAEHHRTCSVGMVPPPPTDREKLIAEATEFIDSWDRLGSWTPDSPIGMVMRLRNALAAPLDPVKVAEVERAAAARALDQIADILDGYAGTILNAESASDIVRARAAEMREGKLT